MTVAWSRLEFRIFIWWWFDSPIYKANYATIQMSPVLALNVIWATLLIYKLVMIIFEYFSDEMAAKRVATTGLDWGALLAKIPAENKAAFAGLKVNGS